jgi:hypothetical protein
VFKTAASNCMSWTHVLDAGGSPLVNGPVGVSCLIAGLAGQAGFLADRVTALRAEADAAVRDAYAATYDERVIDGISGHYLPMAAPLTPASASLVCDGPRLDLGVLVSPLLLAERQTWTTPPSRST